MDPHPTFLSPRRLGGDHKDEVAVSNWLSGRNEPTVRNLLRLSTALKVGPMELIGADAPQTAVH